MKQMDIRGLQVVDINYSWRSLAPAVQVFKPVVYKQDDIYCCLFGSDPQTGVFGSGDNPKKAMQDWEQNFHKRIATGNKDDEVVAYILEKLACSKNRKL